MKPKLGKFFIFLAFYKKKLCELQQNFLSVYYYLVLYYCVSMQKCCKKIYPLHIYGTADINYLSFFESDELSDELVSYFMGSVSRPLSLVSSAFFSRSSSIALKTFILLL